MDHRSDLKIYDDNNNEITVTINDALGLILNSPLITQAFLKALAKVAVSVIGGTISEIIIVIDEIKERTEVQIHHNRMSATITKLEDTTKLCANAVANAEASNYPPYLKDKLVGSLVGLFEDEMMKLVPPRKRY